MVQTFTIKTSTFFALRKRVGMVFQKPNPFPKSIFENVAYGLKIQGVKDKKLLKKKLSGH